MERKLPAEAFDFYVSLGLKRSYQAVADKFGVSKVAVVNLAKKERWQERIAEIEAQARDAADKRIVQSREEVHAQFVKTWEAAMRRSLEGLRAYPFASAIDAVRALHLATKNLLLLRGEPTERVDNIETIIRREYERWTKREDGEDWDEVEGEGEGEPEGDSGPEAAGDAGAA